MNESNNSSNNQFDDWGFPKSEKEETINSLSTNNGTIINNNTNTVNTINNASIDTVNNTVNTIISNTISNNINNTNNNITTNTINNNVNSIINEDSKNSIFSDIFLTLNMRFIVPGLIIFGSFYALFGAFGNSKIIYILVLSFCFGYSGC